MTATLDPDQEPKNLTAPAATQVFRQAALLLGCIGVLAILVLGVGDGVSPADVPADLAVASLGLAVVAGAIHGVIRTRLPAVALAADEVTEIRADPGRSSKWWALLLVCIAVIAVFSWFEPGTVFAGGDDTPPVGLAWIAHMFAAWSWTGSSLGSPSSYQCLLPWGVVLEVVHWFGGSAGMAQQIWFTLLFAGSGAGAFGLLRLLRITPSAAFVGGLTYLFNPYVLSFVNNNPVFLAAMAAMAAVGCCVLAVGSGRLSVRAGTILVALISPLVGYAYTNPPTLVIIIAGAAVTAGAAGIVYGRQGLRRCGRYALVAVPVFALVSAYWLVPAAVAATWAASSTLGPVSSWAWTEVRSTLGNAIWLNTQWSWKNASAFPFAPTYAHFPMMFIRFLLPAVAFAAVPLSFTRARRWLTSRRLVLTAATVALLLILLSNGTRSPGDILFNLLYGLPHGWLLREPVRFLVGAAFAYAVLFALSMQAIVGFAGGIPKPRNFRETWTVRQGVVAVAVVLLTVLAVLVPAYPLLFGQTVVTTRPGTLPSQHVRVPAYWDRMASYLNGPAPAGTVLMLPFDSFYQVRYDWGYDGAEGFITDMIARHVVNPSPQGYFTVSSQLETGDLRLERALDTGHWGTAESLANAMGITYVLVRGDVVPHHTVAPATLIHDLSEDPRARLVHTEGPLEMYRIGYGIPVGDVVTDPSSTPNLEALPLFKPGSVIIQSSPRPGLPALIETPELTQWDLSGDTLQATVKVPSGRPYTLRVVHTWLTGHQKASTAIPTGFTDQATSNGVRISTPVAASIVTAEPVGGAGWQTNDCVALTKSESSAATVVHGTSAGGGAVDVNRATVHTCESTNATLTHGPVLVSLLARNVSAGDSRVCVLDTPSLRCASEVSTLLAPSVGWRRYQFVVSPGRAASAVQLQIDTAKGAVNTVQYADVSLHPLDLNRIPVLVSSPVGGAHLNENLVQTPDTSSSLWKGPSGSQRVTIDGLRNGWLSRGSDTSITYWPRYLLICAYAATLLGITLLLGLALTPRLLRQRARPRGAP